MSTVIRTATVPVIETFGPTIQGEGALAGLPTLFARFGGCDYRCSWCDSMFAVEPAQVRENAVKLTADEVFHELEALSAGRGMWVTLSGGNPALLHLGPLVERQQESDYLVAVETQGSVWRDWLAPVDHLTVSPKPPSSGMATERHGKQTARFLATAEAALPAASRSLKIVVFDVADLAWARSLICEADPDWQTFLSVGTDPVTEWGVDWARRYSDSEVRRTVGERYRWLCEQTASDPAFTHTRVLPQLHVVAWGHTRAV
jgi:7-carboxy-7-deazaguanine synthase